MKSPARCGAVDRGFAVAAVKVPFITDEPRIRAAVLGLFDLFASAEKTLHANPGKHAEIPMFELGSSLRFFTRHLS